MFDELLDPRIEGKFERSFIGFFKRHLDEGISHEQLTTYMNSEEFRVLNQQAQGYGPAYLGLILHKQMAAEKIAFQDGRYVEGRSGINSTLDPNLTPARRRELARILVSGLVVGEGAGEGLPG